MKNKSFLLVLFLAVVTGCTKDDTNSVPRDLEVNNFIWKGLNQYYLWQADVPDLADNRFGNQNDLNNFLRSNTNSYDFFQNLLYKPKSKFTTGAVDRFSVIFDDYEVLEGLLSGNTLNNGADFGLKYKPNSTEIFGWIRYVLPNSDASTKNVQRGMIFTGVDGQTLNASNYQSLLSKTTYTINLADYSNNNGTITFTPNGQSITLTGSQIAENPVYKTNVITNGSHKIGYLMYNGFYSDEANETALNNAFGQLKSENLTEFVLDLRYNSGGSIATSTRLASMITGQPTNQIFAKQQWNSKAQAYYESSNPNDLINFFTDKIGNGQTINSLNLNKIYILTSQATASASELVINGLKPYMTVVQLGDKTVGKNVGSVTLYDSKNFGKSGASTNHKYAMQPLVLKITDKNGFGNYTDGLQPTFFYIENFTNLGVIGDANEPLFKLAIDKILTGNRTIAPIQGKVFEEVKNPKAIDNIETDMYLDKLPFGLFKN
jgi:carboxyl-terminal processing protease